MKKKCPTCGTAAKTTPSEAPSMRKTGAERASRAAASPQGVPKQPSMSSFPGVDHDGENPTFVEKLKHYSFVNRIDTPKQMNTGGPVVLNEGENIHTIYPRRTDAGRTIRSNEE